MCVCVCACVCEVGAGVGAWCCWPSKKHERGCVVWEGAGKEWDRDVFLGKRWSVSEDSVRGEVFVRGEGTYGVAGGLPL